MPTSTSAVLVVKEGPRLGVSRGVTREAEDGAVESFFLLVWSAAVGKVLLE